MARRNSVFDVLVHNIVLRTLLYYVALFAFASWLYRLPQADRLYLTFVEGYREGLAAAAAKGEIVEGPDELRAWALIGMSVFLGMRYGIWRDDMPAEQVADLAIDFVSEGLRKRGP